jgi:outer membrane protein OmpA-like peptidoglycan-associated protein
MLLLSANGVHAQNDAGACGPPRDKKVEKLLADAEKARDPAERHRKLKSTLDIDPDCAECLLRTGVSAYERGRATGAGTKAAEGYLSKLDALCPGYHADVPWFLGHIAYAGGEHGKALDHFEAFRSFPTDDPRRMGRNYDRRYQESEDFLPDLRFAVEFYANQAPFDPQPLEQVNTEADEYLPMLSPDNDLLFYTRLSKHKPKGYVLPVTVEELTHSRRAGAGMVYGAGVPLPEPFNQGDSYGGVTISVNNKEMFVTVCKQVRPDYKNCDIYRSHYDMRIDLDVGGPVYEWTDIVPLGPEVNTPLGWESQPTLSADGRTMYFATNREGSRGMDIYQSTRNDQGEWSEAEPVPGINTDGDEKAPFLHSDSRTLYFAARPRMDHMGRPDPARGHRGAGGYDIFYSRMDDDGNWSTPRNLGHPINTPDDEHGLIVSADGRTAFFASNRFKGPGGLDIFGFSLPKEARPEDILVVSGDLRDEQGRVVTDATVEIKYMDTRRTEVIRVDERDGSYAGVLRLKEGDDVVLTVKKPGHVFDSRVFTAADTARGGSAAVEMTVQPIAVGRSYRVNDIRYATASAEIDRESEHILEELIIFLQENPTVRIRIEGHTDNVGGMEDNMRLSEARAGNVARYLQGRGITKARIGHKGLGPTKPVATNDTSEGRALNRRTEFVIVGR